MKRNIYRKYIKIVSLGLLAIILIAGDTDNEKSRAGLLHQVGLFESDLSIDLRKVENPLFLSTVKYSLYAPLKFESYLDTLAAPDTIPNRIDTFYKLIDQEYDDSLLLAYDNDIEDACEDFSEYINEVDNSLEKCFSKFELAELDSFTTILYSLLSGNIDPSMIDVDIKLDKEYTDDLLRRDKEEELWDLMNISQIKKYEKIDLDEYFRICHEFGRNAWAFTEYILAHRDELEPLDTDECIVFDGMQEINTSDYNLIINISGDDVYSFTEARRFNSCVIIDLEGNDRYSGENMTCSGFFSNFFLYEAEGEDSYSGHDYSLGASFFGTSLIADLSGNDNYKAHHVSLGAGYFGWGAILDYTGDDVYSGGRYTQGFGYMKGLGFIEDHSGFDIYNSTSKSLDRLRHKDHYITMAQGMGYGYLPDFFGGIGMIFDHAGNDTYSSDIFGQGGGYWYALGVIYDRQGNDNYIGYQYSQGAGVHLAGGYLIDLEGNDYYYSWAVSQGCGHDLSVGRLVDRSGNDEYHTNHLGQGAGNANGIGFLEDLSGDDFYIQYKDKWTRGYGDIRKDYGSIGIFLDFLGKDKYYGVGRDSTWWQNSRYGIGADYE